MKTFALAFFLAACAAPPEPDVVDRHQDLTLQGDPVRGAVLFAAEKFGGNDRTCATCHRLEPDQHTTLTPAFAQALYARNPHDPLFRSLDSDNGAGSSYATLLRTGDVRIPFTLPANVTVAEPSDGVHVQHNANGTTTVWVLRSTPSVQNIDFETSDAPAGTVGGNIMWDGREGSNLNQQAIDAVNTHAQPTRQPTTQDAADIASFQKLVYSSIPLLAYSAGAAAPQLPPGVTDAQKRGRVFFVDSGPVIDANHQGLCATCHGGPLLNTTTVGNPVQPPGMRASNNLVSETNSGSLGFPALGLGLTELTYSVTLTSPALGPFDPATGQPTLLLPGTVLTLKTSDPGRILTTGNPCETPLNCVLNPGGFLSLFKIPTLWGSASTAPYFHDNSAASIDAVMDRYVLLFGTTAAALGNPDLAITPQKRADIIAYFEYAFR